MASELKSLDASARSGTPRETNDPPAPAYTSAAADADADPFSLLRHLEIVVIVNDSTSMRGLVDLGSSTSSRWNEVADVLCAIATIVSARNPDGIDIYFLTDGSTILLRGSNGYKERFPTPAPPGKCGRGYYNICTAAKVADIFKAHWPPLGRTPTGDRLGTVLRPYLEDLIKEAAAKQQQHSNTGAQKQEERKPMNVIVITDGRPTDDPTFKLTKVAKELDRLRAPAAQLGVQFFQVGNDADAREGLQELADTMAKDSSRDYVDCVTWDDERAAGSGALTAEGILKVVLDSVSKRLDSKNMGMEG